MANKWLIKLTQEGIQVDETEYLNGFYNAGIVPNGVTFTRTKHAPQAFRFETKKDAIMFLLSLMNFVSFDDTFTLIPIQYEY